MKSVIITAIIKGIAGTLAGVFFVYSSACGMVNNTRSVDNASDFKLAYSSSFGSIASIKQGISSEVALDPQHYGLTGTASEVAWREFWNDFMINDDVMFRLTVDITVNDSVKQLIKDSYMAIVERSNELGGPAEGYNGRIGLKAFFDDRELVIIVTDNGEKVRFDDSGDPVKRGRGVDAGMLVYYPEEEITRAELRLARDMAPGVDINDNEFVVVLGRKDVLKKRSVSMYIMELLAECLKMDTNISPEAIIPDIKFITEGPIMARAGENDPILKGLEVESLEFNGTDEYSFRVIRSQGPDMRRIFSLVSKEGFSETVITLEDGTELFVREVEDGEEEGSVSSDIVDVVPDTRDRQETAEMLKGDNESGPKKEILDRLTGIRYETVLSDDDRALVTDLLEFFLWNKLKESREETIASVNNELARSEDIAGQLEFLVRLFSYEGYSRVMTEDENKLHCEVVANMLSGDCLHKARHLADIAVMFSGEIAEKEADEGNEGLSDQGRSIYAGVTALNAMAEHFDIEQDPSLALLMIEHVLSFVHSAYAYNKRLYEIFDSDETIRIALRENEDLISRINDMVQEGVEGKNSFSTYHDFTHYAGREVKRLRSDKTRVEFLGSDFLEGVNTEERSPLKSVDMKTLIQNLVMNSIEASRRVAGDADVDLEVGLSFEKRTMGGRTYVIARYADNGPGMTEEIKQKLLRKERFSSREKFGIRGGKGMLLIHEKIEEAGGVLYDIESSPGEGTTFVMHFPEVSKDGTVQKPQPEEIIEKDSRTPYMGTFMGEEIEFSAEGFRRCNDLLIRADTEFARRKFAVFIVQALSDVLVEAKDEGVEFDNMNDSMLFMEQALAEIEESIDITEQTKDLLTTSNSSGSPRILVHLMMTKMKADRTCALRRFCETISTGIHPDALFSDQVQESLQKIFALTWKYTVLMETLEYFSNDDNADYLEYGVFDINREIMDEVEYVKMGIEKDTGKDLSAVKIDIMIDDSPFLVNTSQRLLRDILKEALKNSISSLPYDKHMLVKGTLAIHVAMEGSSLKVSVADTGSGISSEDLENLQSIGYTSKAGFRTRLDSITKEGGFGLGIPMVLEIVKFIDGTSSIVSQEGKGTTLTVTLPNASVRDDTNARVFSDNIKRVQAKEEKALDFIVYDPTFIKGYFDNTKRADGQRAAMAELLSNIQDLVTEETDEKIKWIVGGEDPGRTAEEVNEYIRNHQGARGMVLGGEGTVRMIEGGLTAMGREKDTDIILAGVDNRNMDEMGYVPVMEMFRVMLDVYRAGDKLNDDYRQQLIKEHPLLGIVSLSEGKITFEPNAKAMDYPELKRLYMADVYA